MSDRLPISDPAFWRERIHDAGDQPHRILFNIDIETWLLLRETHREILSRMFHPYQTTRVLDAGCGYGDLLEALPSSIDYTGIDISPDLIEMARQRYPERTFHEGNLLHLPFPAQHFQLAICRSIDGMVKDNQGIMVWRAMERELLRVSERLLLLNYTEPSLYRIHDNHLDAKEFICNQIHYDGGRLTYRAGQDGTIELYDLFVDETQRRKGVASRLVEEVCQEAFGTVYGFIQIDNPPIHAVYRKLGFTLTPVPGFYRGVDAIMVSKLCTPSRSK